MLLWRQLLLMETWSHLYGLRGYGIDCWKNDRHFGFLVDILLGIIMIPIGFYMFYLGF